MNHNINQKPIGAAVLRISIPYVMGVIDQIKEAEGLNAQLTVINIYFQINDLKSSIVSMYGNSVFTPYLRVSRPRAVELIEAIDVIANDDLSDPEKKVHTWQIRHAAQSLRPLLTSELGVLPTFLVTGKEGFDVNILIENGESLFPTNMISKVKETALDAKEVGKALAFELPTSCGFHTFRVVESVAKKYWLEVTKNSPLKLNSIGNIAAELEKGLHGDPRVWESLKQLAKLHRNPITHAEVILTVSEAIGILGISRSTIGAMLPSIQDEPITTGALAAPESSS